MSRESLHVRLEQLQDRLGTARRTGTLTIPTGLNLDSTKGRAWLAVNLPEWPVVLVPEPVKDIEAWRRLYAPHDEKAT